MLVLLLIGQLALEAAVGLCVVVTVASPPRSARNALALLALLLTVLALAAVGIATTGGVPGPMVPPRPALTALAAQGLLVFSAAMVLAVLLTFVGREPVARGATAFAATSGLVALIALAVLYGGLAPAVSAVATASGAITVGGVIVSLALSSQAQAVQGSTTPCAQQALALSVAALTVAGFLVLAHVALGFPGPSARGLIRGSVGGWFWLRLVAGLAIPLALGLAGQRVRVDQPWRLAKLLAAMLCFLALGEMGGRLLLVHTALLF